MKSLFFKGHVKAIFFFIALWLFSVTNLFCEPLQTTMVQAVVCESIKDFQPVNPAVVFSISQGEVFCFSNFDPVIKKTHIFHKWYKRDKLIFTMRLTLSPPKWSSFSRIQLRGADKGPWRVVISDADDTLLKTLRFSMVD
jgi:hypothetical protein